SAAAVQTRKTASASRTEASIVSGTVRSPRINSASRGGEARFGSRVKARTCAPLSRSCATTWRPTVPGAPVTRIRFTIPWYRFVRCPKLAYTPSMKPKNTICLWFDKDAVDAARFYAGTFPDSEVTAVHEAPGDYPGGKEGDVLTVEFTV